MMIDIKNIHIGNFIFEKVKENKTEISRICNFLKCDEKEVYKMYEAENLDTNILLKWSKLLEYDFFRIYTQHLILYAPVAGLNPNKNQDKIKSKLPQFRKNIYTKEIIDFILDLIETNQKSKQQVIEEYNIPKTTLYKWIIKHSKSVNQ